MVAEWLPFDITILRSLGFAEDVVDVLGGRGLPKDTYKMFLRNPGRELELRVLPGCGAAAFLGQHEDGLNSYWVLIEDASVWMLHGYDGGVQRTSRINSSVSALQAILSTWDEFIGSGLYEENPSYEGLVSDVVTRAQRADPVAFGDDESWWSVVFEEIENGVLAPE